MADLALDPDQPFFDGFSFTYAVGRTGSRRPRAYRLTILGFPLILIKPPARAGPKLARVTPMEAPMFGCGKAFFAFALLIATPVATIAQTTDNQPAPSSQAPPSQSAAQPEPDQQLMKPEQLEALVAPIALYPDELLANVLAASTYPLEAVQADRWVKANNNLKGDALKAAVDKQAWDDSIKALAGTPDVLAMMSDKIDWTKNLGDAVLAQQADVMDAV